MGFGFSLGFGKDKNKSKSSSKSTTTTNVNENVSGVSATQGSESQVGTQLQQGIQTALGVESLAQLQNLIQQTIGQATPEAQQASRDAAITQALEAGMGDVIALGTNAGAYDSTVQGTAGQRLTARAAIEGQAAQDMAIQNLLGLVTGMFGIEKGAVTQSTDLATQIAQILSSQVTAEDRTRTATEKSTTNSSGKSSSKGSSSKIGITGENLFM